MGLFGHDAEAEGDFDLVEHSGLRVLIGNLIEGRQFAADIFVDHAAARAHAVGTWSSSTFQFGSPE